VTALAPLAPGTPLSSADEVFNAPGLGRGAGLGERGQRFLGYLGELAGAGAGDAGVFVAANLG
jgi:hypothetical protein